MNGTNPGFVRAGPLFNWANAILAEPLRIVNGAAVIPERSGTGVSWNEDAVKRYRVK